MHQLLKRFLGLRRRFQSSASKTSLFFFFLGLSSFRNTMMRSSHLDLHHQEELHGFSSSGGAVPAFCDLATNREWNQNQILSCDDFISNANAVLSSQRDFSLIHGVSPVKSHMIPDLGFHWAINKEEGFMNQLPAHQLHLAKIKEGLLENSFRKLNGFYKDPSINEDYQLHEKLVSRKLPSDCQIDGLQPLPGNLSQHSSFGSCGGDQEISMSFPTTHLSHSGLHPPLLSGSLDMDLHAMDLLASARTGRSFCQPSFFTDMSLLRGDTSSGLDHLQESIQGPFYHHHKVPSLVSGVAEARGSNSAWEHNSSHAASRKPQFEQRSSFSPFKVRKEKLGDRIAALQQLVAPFGKTDTASVLMEAIGYIKFLLEQVEKLSVPYMRSSGNKRSRTMQEASNDEESNNIEALKLDLRSRGLCLVPLSCTSYMTTEHVVWSP